MKDFVEKNKPAYESYLKSIKPNTNDHKDDSSGENATK